MSVYLFKVVDLLYEGNGLNVGGPHPQAHCEGVYGGIVWQILHQEREVLLGAFRLFLALPIHPHQIENASVVGEQQNIEYHCLQDHKLLRLCNLLLSPCPDDRSFRELPSFR